MFRTFIQKQLEKSEEPHFLVIGEDHIHSSALIGLAHCLQDIKESGKKVIIITEDLKRQTGFFGSEKSYTAKEVEKNLSATDGDIDALRALIKDKVEVYGLESERTAPPLFFRSKTKQELFNEAMKKMPYIFENKELKDTLTKRRDDRSVDFDTFDILINRAYEISAQRMVNVNNEIVSQMLLAAKNNPGNTLVIFCGGAAHLAEAKYIQNNNTAHPGVYKALQNSPGKPEVNCCFFSSLSPTDKSDYTPKQDDMFYYSAIPNQFSVPHTFSAKGSPLDVIYSQRKDQLANTANQKLFTAAVKQTDKESDEAEKPDRTPAPPPAQR